MERPKLLIVASPNGSGEIVEPTKKKFLLKLLNTWEHSDETLPDVDQGLLSLDDVELPE
jgi:hypothetical protein